MIMKETLLLLIIKRNLHLQVRSGVISLGDLKNQVVLRYEHVGKKEEKKRLQSLQVLLYIQKVERK